MVIKVKINPVDHQASDADAAGLSRLEEVRWQVSLARISYESLRQRGFAVSPYQELILDAERLFSRGSIDRARAACCRVRAELSQPLPRQAGWPYLEPSDLQEILPLLPSPESQEKYDQAHYLLDVTGAWLGLNIGSALGLAVENWSADRIRQEVGEITDYVLKPPSTLNDDTTFQVISLHALEEHGLDFTAWDLGLEWVEHMPFALTAEASAITNLQRGLKPPETAQVENPFCEWVGGAMKAEIWGLLAPGQPQLAIRYAHRDGSIAHQANGLYGAYFVAALVSLAFVEQDLERLLNSAVTYIPPTSRLSELISRCLIWSHQYPDWRQALAQFHKVYAAYDTMPYGYVHVFPCLASALIGFLYGGRDFERSICIAAMCGGDADFPPALVGTVLGLWRGESRLPAKWRDPIGQEMECMALGIPRQGYTALARRICEAGHCILEADW
jgi:ADP-ribosylglycohydrolase